MSCPLWGRRAPITRNDLRPSQLCSRLIPAARPPGSTPGRDPGGSVSGPMTPPAPGSEDRSTMTGGPDARLASGKHKHSGGHLGMAKPAPRHAGQRHHLDCELVLSRPGNFLLAPCHQELAPQPAGGSPGYPRPKPGGFLMSVLAGSALAAPGLRGRRDRRRGRANGAGDTGIPPAPHRRSDAARHPRAPASTSPPSPQLLGGTGRRGPVSASSRKKRPWRTRSTAFAMGDPCLHAWGGPVRQAGVALSCCIRATPSNCVQMSVTRPSLRR